MPTDEKHEEFGRRVVKAIKEHYEDPNREAKEEAFEDAKERRQELTLEGFRAMKKQASAKEVTLADLSELRYYLTGRKGELAGDVVEFDHGGGRARASWHETEVRIALGEREEVVPLSSGALLSGRFEEALDKL